MRRDVLVVGCCLGLALGALGLVQVVTTSRVPTYSVATVLAGLRRQPRAWAGRTILVRGWVDRATTFCPLTMAVCSTQWIAVWGSRRWDRAADDAALVRLQLSVPPGVAAPVNRGGQAPGLVQAVLPHLPRGLARLLSRLFVGDSSQTLHVRLSPTQCQPDAIPQACVDGILLSH